MKQFWSFEDIIDKSTKLNYDVLSPQKNWVGTIAPLLYNATHDHCFYTHKLGYEWLTSYIQHFFHLGYVVLYKTIWCKRWVNFVKNEVPFEWFNIEWICIMQLELNSNTFDSIHIEFKSIQSKFLN
jgi:hypothetical protein